MRSRSRIGAVVFMAGLIGTAAPLRGQDAPKAEPEGSYASPRAVFDAAQKATKKKDYKAFALCLTPDSRDMLAGQMVTTASMFKAFSAFDKQGKLKDKLADLDKIFEKHGLTKDVLDKIGKESKEAKDQAKSFKALAAPVKNKPAFIGDVVGWMDKLSGGKSKGSPLENAELKDLKVTGDKASGKVVSRVGEKEKEEPMDFVKARGGWLIVMPLPKPAVRKGPPPPPPPGETAVDKVIK